MKKLGLNRMVAITLLISGAMVANGQGIQSEVPGDNFSLEGALELFKKSSSPEEFEKLLNSENGKVNNLDLNGDGYTDYIRVIDRNEGNVHAFILQAMISERESQDVAVIELEKLANGKAVLQITGDADIYGIETIIEPTEQVKVYGGTTTSRTVVNVWTWPSVQYIYSPYYTSVWVSPWRYSVRPVWYRPWRPVAYYVYNPWWSTYRPYYTTCHTHRVVYAQHIYRPYRTTSVYVYNRHQPQISHYRSTHHRDYNSGRNRYDDTRSNGHQNNNRYNYGNSNGRNKSYSNQYTNSKPSQANRNQYKQQNNEDRKSPDVFKPTNERRSETTPPSDFRREQNTPQRTSSTTIQRDFSTKKHDAPSKQDFSRKQMTGPSSVARTSERPPAVQRRSIPSQETRSRSHGNSENQPPSRGRSK